MTAPEDATPHPAADCCCWCATEREIVDAFEGRPTKRLRFGLDADDCPYMAIDDAPDEPAAGLEAEVA